DQLMEVERDPGSLKFIHVGERDIEARGAHFLSQRAVGIDGKSALTKILEECSIGTKREGATAASVCYPAFEREIARFAMCAERYVLAARGERRRNSQPVRVDRAVV